MSLIENFWVQSEAYENSIAFVEGKNEITFAEFKAEIKLVAGGMQKIDLQKNDTILLAIPVSVSFYIHLIAAWYAGLQVLIITDFKDKVALQKTLRDLNVKYIITNRKISLLKYFILPHALWQKTKVVPKFLLSNSKIQPLSENHIALITTTSGTTGAPKIAQRNIGFLKTQFDTIQNLLQHKNGDVHLSSFPIVLLCNLLVGATSILVTDKNYKNINQNSLQNKPPTILSLSPFFTEKLFIQLKFETIKSLYVGGASMFSPLAGKLKPYADKVKIIYGSTEVEPITLASLADFLAFDKNEKGVFVGKLHKNLNLKILDEENGIGEIAVSGNHVLPKENLLHGHKLYEEIDGEIYYRTGDLGYLKNGNLFFYGRKKYAWLYKNELYSPVLCEKWNAENQIFSEATMLQIGVENVVFYVGEKNKEQAFKKNAPFDIHLFKQLKKMPKDNRHHSRIDYAQLLKQRLI